MDFRADSSYPRGIRNNNPGNLDAEGWIGQVGTDGSFAIFSDTSYGLRALAKDIINAVNEGYNTIETFIAHYAPPSENDTSAYTAAVFADSGIVDPITLPDDLPALMRAIIDHEQGANFSSLISDNDILNGIGMAGGGIIGDAENFLAANPEISVAAAIGAVILIIVIILVATKKLNKQTLMNLLAYAKAK